MENESGTGNIKVKRSTLYKIFGFIILAIAVAMFFSGSFGGGVTASSGAQNKLSGNVAANSEYVGDAQIVKMRIENGRYILEPSSIKVGTPVRIEADLSQMPGCSKSVVISAFNIRKVLSSDDNVIEFTPDKAGTFNIACSMNMYKGTFTILQSDGTKSDYVEKASATGSTCGGAGGGCGCGG